MEKFKAPVSIFSVNKETKTVSTEATELQFSMFQDHVADVQHALPKEFFVETDFADIQFNYSSDAKDLEGDILYWVYKGLANNGVWTMRIYND